MASSTSHQAIGSHRQFLAGTLRNDAIQGGVADVHFVKLRSLQAKDRLGVPWSWAWPTLCFGELTPGWTCRDSKVTRN